MISLSIPRLLQVDKRKAFLWIAGLTVLVTVMDWVTGKEVSLAAFYVVPILMASVAFRPTELAAFSIICSYIRSWFDLPGSSFELTLRFLFAAAAYFVAGVFVGALIRNREQAVRHLEEIEKEQKLRREAEEQLRALAASSPAAILTVDGSGGVLAANDAAKTLLLIPENAQLVGQNILNYFPFLSDALRFEALGLRTVVECQGHRHDGELFLAHLWFSTYHAAEGKRLAAIVVDSSEELRDREEESLRQLATGNQIAVSAIGHEIGNICEAMAFLGTDLRHSDAATREAAVGRLETLTARLRAISHLKLPPPSCASAGAPLAEILDNLRIVLDPQWQEIDGAIHWQVPSDLPAVRGDSRGLLHALLSVGRNRLRAVQGGPDRELDIDVEMEDKKVVVRFRDAGTFSSETAFRPYQEGTEGEGFGMYISRFLVRSYGGDLRHEPRNEGSCFVVELTAA